MRISTAHARAEDPCMPSAARVRILDGSNYMSIWFACVHVGTQAKKWWNGIDKPFSLYMKEGKEPQQTNHFPALDKPPWYWWWWMAVTIAVAAMAKGWPMANRMLTCKSSSCCGCSLPVCTLPVQQVQGQLENKQKLFFVISTVFNLTCLSAIRAAAFCCEHCISCFSLLSQGEWMLLYFSLHEEHVEGFS